ncbi:MAG TPA: YbjQ family protein [Longimicrobiaceae bacterium]|nr:YbjQ family protein [Longimicrobiaceae bacterium]
MDEPAGMIATTTLSVEGYRIQEYLGVVRGVVVRSPTIAQGFLGGLKTIVGGQIHQYTAMCEQTRQQATAEMMRHAAALGANAVVGIGYDASEVRESATEVLCYGTAVRVERV